MLLCTFVSLQFDRSWSIEFARAHGCAKCAAVFRGCVLDIPLDVPLDKFCFGGDLSGLEFVFAQHDNKVMVMQVLMCM